MARDSRAEVHEAAVAEAHEEEAHAEAVADADNIAEAEKRQRKTTGSKSCSVPNIKY